jgi:hypothetical protein
MIKNLFKLSIALSFVAVMLAFSPKATAYPPFVKKAEKFGAKNCLFCHKQPSGGEGWNERGEWLIAEKDKRKADAVDPEWLADYKEDKEGEIKKKN